MKRECDPQVAVQIPRLARGNSTGGKLSKTPLVRHRNPKYWGSGIPAEEQVIQREELLWASQLKGITRAIKLDEERKNSSQLQKDAAGSICTQVFS